MTRGFYARRCSGRDLLGRGGRMSPTAAARIRQHMSTRTRITRTRAETATLYPLSLRQSAFLR